MIGIDITSINRFKNKSLLFIKKVLSLNELKEWEQAQNKELFVAQRWAIKEAIFKANNLFHDFSKIDISRNKLGKFEFENFEISTSKEDDYIVAFVLERK